MATNQAGADIQQYLTFEIGEEQYGINILKVREILRFEPLTYVPQTPAFIKGVINLRGYVVPVVDLAVKFGFTSRPVTKLSCIVIVEVNQEGEKTTLGVVCDSVNQVIDLQPTDIAPPPSFGTKAHINFLTGMGKIDKKFALLLDTEKVLSMEELRKVEEVSASQALAAGGETAREANA